MALFTPRSLALEYAIHTSLAAPHYADDLALDRGIFGIEPIETSVLFGSTHGQDALWLDPRAAVQDALTNFSAPEIEAWAIDPDTLSVWLDPIFWDEIAIRLADLRVRRAVVRIAGSAGLAALEATAAGKAAPAAGRPLTLSLAITGRIALPSPGTSPRRGARTLGVWRLMNGKDGLLLRPSARISAPLREGDIWLGGDSWTRKRERT